MESESSELDTILYRQYLSAGPIYYQATFRSRYRVSQIVFGKLFHVVISHDPYLTQRHEFTGEKGNSPCQKTTATMRLFAFWISNDSMDQMLGMTKLTIQESMVRFCKAVVEFFESGYLRSPNYDDMRRVLQRSKQRGFPGIIVSMDCTKWNWNACLTSWQGKYSGKEKVFTVTLQAIDDELLRIWHAFFSIPGCLNGINVIEASPLIEKIASGTYPPSCEKIIKGVQQNKQYMLTDVIYPNCPIFIATILNPSTNKQKFFSKLQEAT